MREHIVYHIETYKLLVSLLTPLAVLFLGIYIAKKVESIKLNALKEKEWQVKWSDMFLKDAIEFNETISNFVAYLDSLVRFGDKHIDKEKVNEFAKQLCRLEWNIQNYSQFSKKFGSKISENQKILISLLTNLVNNKQGDLEKIRKVQIEYNEFVIQAHNDILKMDSSKNAKP